MWKWYGLPITALLYQSTFSCSGAELPGAPVPGIDRDVRPCRGVNVVGSVSPTAFSGAVSGACFILVPSLQHPSLGSLASVKATKARKKRMSNLNYITVLY